MQLFSPPKSQFTLFSPHPSPNSCANPNANHNFYRSLAKLPINVLAAIPFLKSPPLSSKTCSASSLQEPIVFSESEDEDGEEGEKEEEGKADEKNRALEGLLLSVRRPVKEGSDEAIDSSDGVDGSGGERGYPSNSKIDQGLSEFAKRMPIFEPERRLAPEERPLEINLELALYRAKVLTRNIQVKEAEQILEKCIWFWPEDGRAYVALGKLLCKQSKFAEARSVYERGSQATQGENPYIWQSKKASVDQHYRAVIPAEQLSNCFCLEEMEAFTCEAFFIWFLCVHDSEERCFLVMLQRRQNSKHCLYFQKFFTELTLPF